MAERAIHDTVAWSSSLAGVSDFSRWLFAAMVATFDDWGRWFGDPEKVRLHCIPLLARTETEVEDALRELEAAPRIYRYPVGGVVYCQLLDFDTWQKRIVARRKGESHFPAPAEREIAGISTGSRRGLYEVPRARRARAPMEVQFEVLSLDSSEPSFYSGGAGGKNETDGIASGAEQGAANQPAPRRGRRRDPVFEALCAVCGIDASSLTTTGRGAVNGALRQLKEVGADAEQIRRRAAEYRRRFNTPLTAGALAKHWAALTPNTGQPPEERRYARA